MTDKAIAPDFGASVVTDPGRSAFTHNGGGPNLLAKNFQNVGTALPMVNALGNEWERCYNNQADKNFCNKAAVATDIKNPGVVQYTTSSGSTCDPSTGCEPQRAASSVLATTIASVLPLKTIAGGVVTITGTGFNAIDGHTGYTAADCRALKGSGANHCSPTVQGTCVEFQNPATGQWIEAMDILAVTPASITAKSPIDCSQPTKVRVRRLNLDGPGEVTVLPTSNNFCLNP